MKSELVERVGSFIEAQQLLEGGKTVVVAVSGGCDSVALLHILRELSRRGLRLKLQVAHLNHMIRGAEADADERFVQALAEALKLPCITARRDVPAEREKGKGSLEEVARNVRYDFLGQVARDVGATKIATGHTASDQVETVLGRMVRGTGLRGLAGIPKRRRLGPDSHTEVVRPLLTCWRDEVREFLRLAHLHWREDKSNLDTGIFRNRLRLEVLPMLRRQLDENVDAKLLALSRSAAEVESYLTKQVRGLLAEQGASLDGKDTEVPVEWLMSQPEVVQGYIIRELVEDLSESAVSEKQVASVLALARGHACGRLAQFRGAVEVIREYEKLVFLRQGADIGRVSHWKAELPVPGQVEALSEGFTIETEVITGEAFDLGKWKSEKSRFEEMVDLDRIKGGLKLRYRKCGDRFWPLGAPGEKKLKEFFINAHVPARERDMVPLVVDQEKIVWVAGQRLSESVAVGREAHKLLHLLYKRVDPGGAGE